ncbi:DUF433 domain-containing protein [Actinobacteria bacterium YIM 96077]|uniref:DUF433 domain-containing protein n=1 Tax=Phytoactinopolyspora halophila TaxID=1981511 RepID=A0A329R4P8_9ACTN|nr:DUF433 domain-containing protein [Actinobacteria bacterium YIM 96077]RAW18098.1 DUF433 domain-containing protein [Phytoactinopolyspora halophila]
MDRNIDRIAVDHRIMGGVPCIRGTRIPVSMVVGRLAEGSSREEILADYPQLSTEDIDAAAAVAESRVLISADTDLGSCWLRAAHHYPAWC